MSTTVPFATTLRIRDACLCLHAQRAARTLARLFDDALGTVGLTNQQFCLLMALNRPEPPPMGPVARLLALDRTTLTAALKPLERRGLVRIEPSASDRRTRLLVLTKAGTETLAAAVPIWQNLHEQIERRFDGRDAGDSGADAVRAALAGLCGD
jgi:DNA-binding MarR family transcriptional regulator